MKTARTLIGLFLSLFAFVAPAQDVYPSKPVKRILPRLC